MPPTPFLGSGASFQGPGPLAMALARQAIGISLIDSFWRATGAEIDPFSWFVAFLGGAYKVLRPPTTPLGPPYDPQGGDPDANLEAPGKGHRRGSKEHPTRLETPMGSADSYFACVM